jgi:hypothetical protein
MLVVGVVKAVSSCRLAAGLVALLTSAGTVGCGGGSGTHRTPAAPKRADCAAQLAAMERVARAHPDAGSPSARRALRALKAVGGAGEAHALCASGTDVLTDAERPEYLGSFSSNDPPYKQPLSKQTP